MSGDALDHRYITKEEEYKVMALIFIYEYMLVMITLLQVANEELRVCALIRSSVASTCKNDCSKDYLDEEFEEGGPETFDSAAHATTSGSTGDGEDDPSAKPLKLTNTPSHISTQDIPVRCAAVRVLANLIDGERVKARRCLCRIAEGT